MNSMTPNPGFTPINIGISHIFLLPRLFESPKNFSYREAGTESADHVGNITLKGREFIPWENL